MALHLRFLGAARNVTGSRYLVESAGKRVLVDCGLYQERTLKDRNWDRFPVPPESLDAVLLTHGHLDHVGYLPRLVADGFDGPIHCTPATAEIAKIVLADSGRIQEEDAERKARRHRRENRKSPHPVQPLYTENDARNVEPLFAPVKYATPFPVPGGLTGVFRDAGHILGSSMLRLEWATEGPPRSLLFSGDVGRWGKPILRDPTLFDSADYVVTESTYGDRTHSDEQDFTSMLADEVNRAFRTGGNLVMPAFAIERSHEILYTLNALLDAGRIPHTTVFLDSPMAIRVTEVFANHPELYDEEMRAFERRGKSPFSFPGFQMTMSAEESKAINRVRGTAVILAGSGMCTGGRIKHHLVQNLPRPESTILFTGYQASGTLGRVILAGPKEVRVLGRTYPVKARIAQIHGFSGHADRGELLRWISSLKTAPRRVFVTHGEPDAAASYAALLRDDRGWDVTVPEFGDTANLD